MNTQELQTLDIPLKKLLAWDHNMRTTNPDQSVQELAASIRSMGLLQSVVVKKAPRDKFAVVAGRRRLLALSLLSESGDIPVSFEVPCRLLPEDADLTEISLAENFHHEPPHPADEFEAFRKLLVSGRCVADIAARFGVTEAVVLKRLALARVNPRLLQEYRDGALNLDMLQAFTLTDDQQLQEQVWKQLKKQHWNHSASSIRSLFSESAIPASDKRVRFVGLEGYEAQGGLVRRDLFAEGENGVYIEDAVLLDQLVANKLATLSSELQGEGWKWVEVLPEADHRVTGRMRRLPPTPEPLSPKRQAKLDALRQELTDLEQQLFTDDEETDENDPRYARVGKLERQIGEIEGNQRRIYSPETRAASGTIVTVDWNGKPEYTYGLLRKEDEAAFQKEQSRSESDDGSAQPSSLLAEADEKQVYSAPLIEFLTTHKTAAVAAELAQNPRIALVAVVHALVTSHFRGVMLDYSARSCLQISTSSVNLEVTKGSPAMGVLDAQATHWLSQMPRQSAPLWKWLLRQDQETLLRLLAFCAATAVNAIQAKTDYDGQNRLAHANALGTALEIEMTRWFTPTAENFFDRVSKAQIIQVLTEADKEVGPIKQAMKKRELAKAAEFDLAGSGWLPQPMRITPDFYEQMESTRDDSPVADGLEQDQEEGDEE